MEGGADVAREEREAAAAVGLAGALDLLERVHREPTGAVQPRLVPRDREGAEERVAVAAGAVTEARALASGPARQVSSAPASSRRSSGIRSPTVATTPGAP